jgi:hypothetical protein
VLDMAARVNLNAGTAGILSLDPFEPCAHDAT